LTDRCRPRYALGAGLALVVVGACVGSGVGVPNDEPDPEAVPRSFSDIQTMIFDSMCAAQCHRGGAAPKGLSLEPQRSIRNLVGVASVEAPDLMRVAPGRPEDSYLVVKLVPSDARRVGSRMPRTGPPFASSKQIRAVQRWISAGATEDWVDEDVDAGPIVVPPAIDAAPTDDAVVDAAAEDAP